MRRFLLMILFAMPAFAVDERPPTVDPLPEVPEPPPAVESGEVMEPDITITRKGSKTIQEYRRSGKVYMIKVVPDIGPPYYFIDTDGDGDINMDVRNSDLDRGSRVNMWKILEWD
jgi:hypothetical protein